LRLSTTVGASAAGVAWVLAAGVVAAGVVAVLGCVVVAVLVVGVVSVVCVEVVEVVVVGVVSVVVVVVVGVVEVVVVDWPDPVSWAVVPVSEAEEPFEGLAPRAGTASDPLSPAAVNPPPASAESSARSARRRALFTGGIREDRSSGDVPSVVVGATSPHMRGTPTGILIGSEP
jgi:hypothetical protein